MSHENDGTRRARDFLDDARPPCGKLRLLPIGLNHAAHGRDFGFPAALPMVRPRPAETRYDKNIGLGCTHRKSARRHRSIGNRRSDHGIPRKRALAVSTALILVVPAASMALLAGPALLISGIASPLPGGWRLIIDILGVAAFFAAAAILLVVAVGRRANHAPASLALGACGWVADGACLWLTAQALHIHLDPATIPVAYIAAAAIIAIPAISGGVGMVEAAVPFILAAGITTSYAEAALVVLTWRVFSFWIPTVAGAGAYASLHHPFHLRTALGRTIVP
jgi:hypothetical protein